MTQLGHLFRASPALRSAIIPGPALALSACTAGESAPHAVPTSAPPAPAKNNASAALQVNARLAALIRATGVTCTDATTANGCTAGTVDSGDFHDVEFSPDCGIFRRRSPGERSRSIERCAQHRQQRNSYSQSCSRPARLRPGDRPRRTKPAVLLRRRNSSEHHRKVQEQRIVQNLWRQADQAWKWRELPPSSTRTIRRQLRARMGECGRTRCIFERNLVARANGRFPGSPYIAE